MSSNTVTNSSGQTLLEVIVATTGLVFVLVAIMSGVVLALSNTVFANNQSLATKRSQEAIETFRRYQVELGWETFHDVIDADGSTVVYCLPTLPTTVNEFNSMSTGGCDTGDTIPDTNFTREVTATVISDTQIEVEATVEWFDRSQVRSSHAKQVFRDWQ